VGNRLNGQTDVTLDEKGRISLPVSLRKILGDAELIIKPSYYEKEKSLWLFPKNVYEAMLDDYDKNSDILSEKDRVFRRRYFNFKDVEIDKAGRIAIPQEYREFANLSKDCLVCGVGDYIEIWDKETYQKNYSETNDTFVSASEDMSIKVKNSKARNQV
jgi:MraZ protein